MVNPRTGANPTTAAPAGMDKAELRKHIVLARKAPVHVSFALGGDGKAVLMMDKRKPGRALEKELKDHVSDAKNPRFGTLIVDPDQPTLARLMVNRACEGMARKLVLALKGTGVRQLEITLEDGSPVESAQGEDEEMGGESGQPEAPGAGVMIDELNVEPSIEASAGESSTDDAESLNRELSVLVKRMIGVIATDPSQQASLAKLATDVRAEIKRNDFGQARAMMDTLTQSVAMSETKDAGAAPSSAAPAKDAVQRYQKCRTVWLATRSKIDTDIRKLSAAIISMDADGTFGDDLEQTFLNVVEPVLSTLDDSLAGTLDQATRATDPSEAARLLDSARATIDSYAAFVAQSEIIAGLDQNPFVPMAIAKTLTASLSALSASIH